MRVNYYQTEKIQHRIEINIIINGMYQLDIGKMKYQNYKID